MYGQCDIFHGPFIRVRALTWSNANVQLSINQRLGSSNDRDFGALQSSVLQMDVILGLYMCTYNHIVRILIFYYSCCYCCPSFLTSASRLCPIPNQVTGSSIITQLGRVLPLTRSIHRVNQELVRLGLVERISGVKLM